jgi:nucleoside-diphosphate-sugar epimerase
MKILITGSASHLARALLPRLLAESSVDEIVGVDRRGAVFAHPRYRHHKLDVRDPAFETLFVGGVEAVVHLAFVVLQGELEPPLRRDRAWIRAANVEASRRVFEAAAATGVRTLVHLSSAAVYAPDPARRAPISEDDPRGALAGFAYAEDKVAVEEILDQLEPRYPRLRVVRLRPTLILGPHAHPFLKELVRSPWYPRPSAPSAGVPRPPPPRLQCVHERDVSEAIVAALFTPGARGAYNLAVADAASLAEFKRLASGFPPRALPLRWVRAALALAWRLFGYGTDPAWLQGLYYDLVLDSSRARRELTWRPRYDSIAACLAAMEDQGEPL